MRGGNYLMREEIICSIHQILLAKGITKYCRGEIWSVLLYW